jgi:hypothetical protein
MDTQQELCKFLEAHFETIQNEYFGIDKEKFILWGGEGVKTPSFSKIDGELPHLEGLEGQKNTSSWKLFPIYHIGKNIDPGKTECPKISNILSTIPKLRNAGFSRLSSNYKIAPHVGYDDSFFRYHLGIIVPDGNVGLTVGGLTYRWEIGKAFWFDDTNRHSAWNFTNEERIVLIVDVCK